MTTIKPIRQFLFFREHPEKIIDAFEQIEKKQIFLIKLKNYSKKVPIKIRL